MKKLVLATLALATIGLGLTPGLAQAAKSSPTYYVSVGDSYSVGYQPVGGSTPGYTVPVARATHLKLVNFGCGGATTSSILHAVGCPDVFATTAGLVRYPTTTQTAAAVAFLKKHRGHIGLITVSIGGNDVTACAGAANPITCVAAAVTAIKTNVAELASDLRAAAGSKVPLIGTTYPDVILAEYVYPSLPATAARIALAKESVVAFKLLINPALKKAYATQKGQLVDVTAATGAYGSLATTTTYPPYGVVPVPVAKVCALTWFCKLGNIHATTKGYNLIGALIVSRYHAMR